MSPDFREAVAARLEWFEEERIAERIWRRDPSVWGGDEDTPELADRLGWLDLHETMRSQLDAIRAAAAEILATFDRVVLLGMGGSSLAPFVLHEVLAPESGVPVFHMVDSTHPEAVRGVEEAGDIDRTLFIVASKSGTTLETRCLFQYFWQATGKRGSQFLAITDPGSALADLAGEHGFRATFLNPPDVGGRYSATSLFGLVPAALVGIDVEAVLDDAARVAAQCSAETAVDANPGLSLAAWMAESALHGRDKLALSLPEHVRSLGLWVEQLVAESTGKDDRGILPIVQSGEDLHRLKDVSTVAYGAASERPAPEVEVLGDDIGMLGGEFFRWEMAVAAAGAILGVNPFDQPNVAESKANTWSVLERAEPPPTPRPIRRRAVETFMQGIRLGDYVAVSAWLPPSSEMDGRLAELQAILVERLGVVVTVGYGPRFLHSTGQLHKGGPQVGHFLQLRDAATRDVSIPDESFTFGDLIAAQAAGDQEALTARGRPVLQVDDLAHLLETV